MALSIFDGPVVIPAKILASGIEDSLSLHKTFPILMKSSGALQNTLRIFGANTVLLIGSVAIFEYGIVKVN